MKISGSAHVSHSAAHFIPKNVPIFYRNCSYADFLSKLLQSVCYAKSMPMLQIIIPPHLYSRDEELKMICIFRISLQT